MTKLVIAFDKRKGADNIHEGKKSEARTNKSFSLGLSKAESPAEFNQISCHAIVT
ncbi:MAG TPA: hypothetical protein VMZ30_16220 [Pyrinomonadaceae bacterium]|nr:hypothetical protein [Pyrinomonadaceae bacterium]